jgi:hypothetical protein
MKNNPNKMNSQWNNHTTLLHLSKIILAFFSNKQYNFHSWSIFFLLFTFFLQMVIQSPFLILVLYVKYFVSSHWCLNYGFLFSTISCLQISWSEVFKIFQNRSENHKKSILRRTYKTYADLIGYAKLSE